MQTTTDTRQCSRGPLVSIEGVSGVGKTYLTHLMQGAAEPNQPVTAVVLDEFSHRYTAGTPDIDRQILRALRTTADYFLRGGKPSSETLLLLAVKMFDFEQNAASLRRGRMVIEGRSIDSVAVYQSLILHPQDPATALARARSILALAARWRLLPDLTILMVDDVQAAVQRAQVRDRKAFTSEEWQLHHAAAALFAQLAASYPERIRILDRRRLDADTTVTLMKRWISQAHDRIRCAPDPTGASDASCAWCAPA